MSLPSKILLKKTNYPISRSHLLPIAPPLSWDTVQLEFPHILYMLPKLFWVQMSGKDSQTPPMLPSLQLIYQTNTTSGTLRWKGCGILEPFWPDNSVVSFSVRLNQLWVAILNAIVVQASWWMLSQQCLGITEVMRSQFDSMPILMNNRCNILHNPNLVLHRC